MAIKVDELGRIVLPIELRKELDINEGDSLEINVTDNKIILQKKISNCIFCRTVVELVKIKNFYVCDKCIDQLNTANIGDVLY